jgi:hypothetical protein
MRFYFISIKNYGIPIRKKIEDKCGRCTIEISNEYKSKNEGGYGRLHAK